ncbi:hypothetical protein FGIG_09461 [Fasciola gigantica]|uniref:Secreted protein n=1 Tax=Fasciola gigantica TaxID=46835 RepID=A0A504YIW6_FASGI|nr:hypothetical protein FGIG_09461 [Fasciola gigantica]
MLVLVSILIRLSVSTQHHRPIPPSPVSKMFTRRGNHNTWQKQMQTYLRSILANKHADLISTPVQAMHRTRQWAPGPLEKR